MKMPSWEMSIAADVQNRIHTMRGMQVILDRDLAELYQVETRTLNQAVKRNIDRFPKEFCFQLTETEFENWKSQNVMSDADRMGLRRPPYAFTESGVAMLSAVLRSDVAVKISVQIINAFVAMRRFISSNALIFQRLDMLELKQSDTDRKMECVLNALESRNVKPSQGIFFDGQVYDAYAFVADLFRSAENSIIILDNYLDDNVLTLLTKRKENVRVTLLTRNISKSLALDVVRCNEQYPPVDIRKFENSHDRFVIIDNREIYHMGASLKDLGKRWFAFSRMDVDAIDILARLGMKK